MSRRFDLTLRSSISVAPVQSADGSFDIYFGPKSPGAGKNYVATLPGKGWFTLFRLYGPKKAFFDKSWIPDDVKKLS